MLLVQISSALIEFTSPNSGDVITVSGDSFSVGLEWEDSTDTPTLLDLKSFTFSLCTGPNNKIKCFTSDSLKVSLSSVSDNKYTAKFSADLGADGVYYVQSYSTTDGGGYLIVYTPRFVLKGMSGTYEPSGEGSAPANQISYNDAAEISKSFSVPYTLQTGKTRYAPMQLQPGSTVTLSTWSRRFPSSAFSTFTTNTLQPNILSTITAGWNYTMSSFTNYATPAPFPSAVGWFAASAKLMSASLDSSHAQKKRKRWDDE